MQEGEFDDATIESAILLLKDKSIIEEIHQLSLINNCKINLYYRKDRHIYGEIYFCIELNDQSKPSSDIDVKIGARLYECTNYFEKIFVNLKSDYTPETYARVYEDETPFTPANYHEIERFFQKHYPECNRSTEVDAHQDKRRRSVSPPRNSLFSQNPNHEQKFDDFPTPEVVAEYIIAVLKEAPFWHALSASPEKADIILDEAFRLLKSKIFNKEQSVDISSSGKAQM